MDSRFIEFQGIDKHYGSFQAVTGFDLTVRKGEMVALLGPSGCGKTTTLRMLAGFVPVTAGTMTLAGRDITDVPAHRRNIGMVFQGYALFPHMTVAENVAFGLEMRRLDKAQVDAQVQDALARVQLEAMAHRLPKQLSGGQQQRVALARAMAINPDVLLLDEPLSALDARLRHEVRDEIRQLQRQSGLTTLIVTHDQDEALSMADRLVVMNQGRIEQIGTPSELYEAPATRFTAGFMGKTNFIEGRVDAPGRFVCADGMLHLPPDAAGRGGSCITFRPERAHLAPAGSDVPADANALDGRIAAYTYLGAVIDCRVHLGSGTAVSVQLANTSSEVRAGLEPGRAVQVCWSVNDTRLLD